MLLMLWISVSVITATFTDNYEQRGENLVEQAKRKTIKRPGSYLGLAGSDPFELSHTYEVIKSA